MSALFLIWFHYTPPPSPIIKAESAVPVNTVLATDCEGSVALAIHARAELNFLVCVLEDGPLLFATLADKEHFFKLIEHNAALRDDASDFDEVADIGLAQFPDFVLDF